MNSQLVEYRLKKQQDHGKKLLLEHIKIKYGKNLIINKYHLAAIRIQRYIKRHFLNNPQNISTEQINYIPSIFRYRCVLSELNIVDDLDLQDYDMLMSVKESINISKITKIYVLIDMRIYGPTPEKSIYVNNNEYYLSRQDKIRINKMWKKVNPSTNNGIVYEQNIKYYKSCSKNTNYIFV